MNGKGTLKLKAPLLINGAELTELHYDFDRLTAADMIEADRQRQDDAGRPALAPVIDRATQLILFALACEKAGGSFTHEDMPRMSYRDAVRAANLARDFTSAEDDGEDGETAGEQGGPAGATPAPPVALPTHPACADGVVPTSRRRSES